MDFEFTEKKQATLIVKSANKSTPQKEEEVKVSINAPTSNFNINQDLLDIEKELQELEALFKK